jgi:hypothetical protein
MALFKMADASRGVKNLWTDALEDRSVDRSAKVLGWEPTSEGGVRPAGEPKGWGRLGVFLVCGEGADIIADWHCGNTRFDKAVQAACERVENLDVTVRV